MSERIAVVEGGSGDTRLKILDGWRAVSILLVLCGHWLPLDLVLPGLNEATGAGGMAIFFTLSGFLITRFLIVRAEARSFLIRRFLRIAPLAWLATLILYVVHFNDPKAFETMIANALFFANLPPQRLYEGGGHLWSLSVEVQFYVGIALLVALLGKRGLLLVPVLALAVTIARVAEGTTINIVTWFRADEILAGATIALIHAGMFGSKVKAGFGRIGFWPVALLALACTYFLYSPLAYLRPYAIAAMVGVSLLHAPRFLELALSSRPAAYVAEVSYAVYVFHGMLGATWLGSGEVVEKYLKRPLLIVATFLAAHVSTFYYERPFIRLAKRLTTRNADVAKGRLAEGRSAGAAP